MTPTTDRWIADFTAELDRRGTPTDRIRDEVRAVSAHVSDAGLDADRVFGDPVAYAATLESAETEDTPSPPTVLALFACIAFFIVFVISAVQWVRGADAAAAWAVPFGAALLASSATLSVILSRRAAAAALRDSLDRGSVRAWSAGSTALALLPWGFVVFAAAVVALAALV